MEAYFMDTKIGGFKPAVNLERQYNVSKHEIEMVISSGVEATAIEIQKLVNANLVEEEKLEGNIHNISVVEVLNSDGSSKTYLVSGQALMAAIDKNVRQKIAQLSPQRLKIFAEISKFSIDKIIKETPHLSQIICKVEKLDIRDLNTSRIIRHCVYQQVK